MRNGVAEVFKNKLRKYDKASDIVAGLINYKDIKLSELETGRC